MGKGECIHRGSLVASDRIPNQTNRNGTVDALVHVIICKGLGVSETQMEVDRKFCSSAILCPSLPSRKSLGMNLAGISQLCYLLA